MGDESVLPVIAAAGNDDASSSLSKAQQTHTIEEATGSYWSSDSRLRNARNIFSAVCLLIAVAIVIEWPPGAFTVLFYALLAQAAVYRLLASGELPGVAMPVYQTVATLSLFEVTKAPIMMHMATSDAIGQLFLYAGPVPLILFLVDACALGARVRFSFAYVWIPIIPCTLSIILQYGWLLTTAPDLFALFSVWIVAAGATVIAITRSVAKCAPQQGS